ncbi:MAG: hypothetical protein WD271_14135 [Acidimicrobiia bacterium]
MNRTLRNPRWVTVALAAFVAVAAFGCGSAGPEVSARNARPQAEPTAAAGTQTVRYRGVEFTVPGDWPVYDLDADPSTCVRFDVHAVYLGHPGEDMQCPANVFGRSEAVLVEPLDGATVTAADTVGTANAHGLAVATDPRAAIEHEVRAALPGAGVAVTISFNDEAAGQQLLQTFKAAA